MSTSFKRTLLGGFFLLLGISAMHSSPVRAVWDRSAISNDLTLTIQQIGQVIAGSSNTVGSTGTIYSNDIVRYEVSYQNEGTTGATDFVLSGGIAPGMCYLLGSLETNLLTGYTLSYSSGSNGDTWTYVPSVNTGTRDCAIRYFKLEKSTLSGSAQIIEKSNITGGLLNNTAYASGGITINPLSIYSQVAPAPLKTLLTGAGTSGGGGVSSREFFQSGHYYRMRQDGTVKRLRLYVAHTTNLTGFYFKIRRPNTGGTFDLVGMSENILPQINSGSISDIVLSSPIAGVEEGDYYGFHMMRTTAGGQLNIPVEAGVGGQNMYFITNTGGAASGFNWPTAGTFTTSTYPIEVYMDQADSVFIGASLVAGHPPHYSFIELSSKTFITGSIQHFFSELSNYTTQNMGMGGQTISSVIARFQRDVLNINPKMVVVSIGFNDIALGTSKEDYMSGWRYILNATDNAPNIQKVVILLLTPWTEGGTGWNITKDDRNQSVTELASGYSKTVVVDAASYIGVEYTGANAVSGNLRYLDAAYDYGDGVHLTTSGNRRVAQALYDTLVSGNVTLNNNLYGDFTMLFTGSSSFTKRKNAFADISLPTDTSVTYSVRSVTGDDCTWSVTGTNFISRISSTASGQISLAPISGLVYKNICLTAHMKTTNRSVTPMLTGLISTYIEAPLTFTYDTVVNDTTASMSSALGISSANSALISSSYSWALYPEPTFGFGGGGGRAGPITVTPLPTQPAIPTQPTTNDEQDTTSASAEEEQTEAYNWAYENKITTLFPQTNARLEDPITREELAKMISQYAMTVHGKQLTSNEKCDAYSDFASISADLKDDVIRACQLGIMGVTSTGDPLPIFRPFDTVTRAEFGAVFSRILRGKQYEGSGEEWYQPHLQALQEMSLMKKIDTPHMNELRGWIMLMLRRQVENM